MDEKPLDADDPVDEVLADTVEEILNDPKSGLMDWIIREAIRKAGIPEGLIGMSQPSSSGFSAEQLRQGARLRLG